MRNRIIGLAAAALASALGGCGDVEETGVLSLTQVSRISIEEDGCGAPDKELVPLLAYDAGVGMLTNSEYLLGLWLSNSLVANDDLEGAATGRINTNRIQVQRIEVEFIDRENWGFLPERLEVGMPFVVDSESEIGWPTYLIPLSVAQALVEHPDSPIRQSNSDWVSLPIRIKAKGELLDGTAVESNSFGLNLTVCNECSGGCPIGYEAQGCTIAQPDMYECVEAETEEPAQ